MFIPLSFYQTPATTLQMPVVVSSSHDCQMRYNLDGGRVLSTDDRANAARGSSGDRYTMVNVSFNWMSIV